MVTWKNFFVGLGFVSLLFFVIPIRIKPDHPAELENQFTAFMQQYNRSYDNDTVYQQRFQAFQQSIKNIDELNSQRKNNLSAFYGLTKFSDMTPEEFMDRHLQSDLYDRISSHSSEESREQGDKIKKHRNKRKIKNHPLKIDWREKGVVTKVNNQKWCGACWAFSTIENMETMYAIKTGNLTRLSVQQLIDCAGYNNNGCKGGDSCTLMEWMRDYDVKVQTEQEYPLQLVNEKCKMKNDSVGVYIDKFACDRLVGDEELILSTLAEVGPVAVAINALTWQNYLGGVVQFHCSGLPRFLNHAVQIVGYDLSADIPHYIVRNSWGEDFGDKGYLYIAIGENLCGLANEVSVLTVS